MNHLEFSSCDHVSQLEWPILESDVQLQSLATKVATDFKQHLPLVIEANTRAVQAEYLMKKTHVKLKIVVDDHNQFIGAVSYNDITNQEIMKKVGKGEAREELMVSDFMVEKSKLKSIDWQLLSHTSIKSLLVFLSSCDDQHVLLTDNNGSVLRGLISASDVVRYLHLDIDINGPVSFRLLSSVCGLNHRIAA